MIVLIVISTVLLSAFLVWASASIKSGVYIKALCRVQTQERVVYLSFDDGPVPERTGKVLDILNHRNAKAAFFLIGKNISGNEEIVRRIYREGHVVGVHSFCHKWNFPLMSRRRIAEELLQTRTAIENITKQDTIMFRPPFGVTNPLIYRATEDCGFKTVGWDVRSYDTVDFDKKDGLRRIAGRVLRHIRPGSIILLHDRIEGSDVLLEMIIDGLDDRGFRYNQVISAGKMP